ncbi:cuticle protein AMP1A-like [Eriocheir sinensis]|uniref:cuticle protein AMP1A-like n=1 Tax=Eriocheir sinensis TaxID=95602 RepID=UPI0021C68ECE|nr:cuticle protein AMP1A-like [Eriocheir sinensis]
MKLVLLTTLLGLAAAAPQLSSDRDAYIITDERTDNGDGNFKYLFETSNGIFSQRTGTPGSEGQSNMQGSERFTFPDGTVAEITYVADENGYRAESPLIPTDHPLPAHVYELLRIAEEQRAKGITFD